ncbi:MAG: hypothetical protein COB45_11350 [Gammaproteobacteria bacterium]|jgi:hypothetical protein|nr:MAG: hypothetical protein COB45_11350 [Gammaproteobacteria bacterium]PHR85588.1 MAG: hypothetical protein COA59_01180 [Colwellia sp.]
MIKVVVVILCIFNILACNPIQQASQKKSTHSQVPFTCLASQSRCDVNTELGTFTIKFSGQVDMGKVKTELPFQIQLTFDAISQHFQLKSVSSYLEGKSMFMGKIPVFFQRAEKISDSLIAQTLLVNCSEEIMTWRLWFTVELENDEQVTQQDFFIDFDSQRL